MEMKSFENLLQAELFVQRAGQQLSVSVFFIDGLLIDTGPFRKRTELISLYEQWEIDKVLLTHHHEDHTGLAYWFQSANIPIYMHQTGQAIAAKQPRLPLYRHLFWGKRPAFQALPLGETIETAHERWEVLHTPGHAKDHVALFNQEKGWLIGGDLYVSPKPKSMYRFESVPEIIQSLRKVLAYDFDVYVCSHAGVLFDGKKLLQRKLSYLIEMQQEVLFLHNKGMSVKQIRKKLFPKHHFLHFISFFENSPQHFIRSVLQGF